MEPLALDTGFFVGNQARNTEFWEKTPLRRSSPPEMSLQPVESPPKNKLFAMFPCWTILLLALAGCTASENREVKIPPLPDNPAAIQRASLLALTDAIEDEPRRSEYYYRRALLYQQAGRKDLALQDLSQAIDYRGLDERYGRYYALRAQLHLEAGRVDSAFRDAERALKLEEGRIAGLRGAARPALRRARRVQKSQCLPRRRPAPHAGRTAALLLEGPRGRQHRRHQPGHRHLRKALELRPQYKEAYNRLSEIYFKMGQTGRPSQRPQRLPHRPGLPRRRTCTWAGSTTLPTRKTAPSCSCATPSRINPDLHGTRHQLAGLHFGSDEFSQALPHYEKLLAHRNRWPEVPYRLYVCYDKSGRGREGLNRYTEILRTDSTNMAALEVYDLLKKRDDQKKEWRALDSLARRRKQLFDIQTIPLEINE
jgi:tetratricopeptide (TPR) repeat protein